MNQRLEEPEDSSGNHRGAGASTHARPTPGSGGDETLGDARGKLAEALQSFSAAEAALPALQAALAAGRIPGKGDLADLERLRSALDGAARAVGIDPERATLADMEGRLSAWEGDVALRRALRRLAEATGPAIAAAKLTELAAGAARLAAAPAWSPEEEARAAVLVRLVDLADATTQDGDEEHILALDAELRRSLGPSAAPVVLAAARGRLVLPAHPAAGSGGPPDGQRPPASGRPPASSAPVSSDGQRLNGDGRAKETAPLSGRGQRAAAPPSAVAVARPVRPPARAGAGSVQHLEHAEGYDRRWWILGVLCLSLLIIMLDNTILNVALPTLVRKLNATTSQLQWMVDAYTLVFAGLLLTMGTLGDRFGRRTTLAAGLAVFGVGSALSAFAGSAGALIATRALMGMGAALIMPSTLSILTNVFPPEERARAIGIWAGISGIAIAIGPIVGGWLLVHFWWGSIFLINLPVVVVALVVGRLIVPNSRDPEAPRLDPVGAGLSIVGLVSLVYGIIEAPSKGWSSPTILTTLGIAAVVLFLFVVWELRSDHPMLNVHFFANPRFTAANVSITLVFFALFGSIFFLTQYLQFVLGFSALQAGIRLAPMALVLMIMAPVAGQLVRRLGNKALVAVGMAVGAGGLYYLSRTTTGSGYLHLLTGLVILAAGLSLSMVPATESIMGSLPPGKAGVGSAMNDTTREVGGALGVAILGSIMASRYSTAIVHSLGTLPAQALAAAKSSVGGAIIVGQTIGGPLGQTVTSVAKSSFVSSMGSTLQVGALVALAGAVVSAIWLPNRAPHAAGIEALAAEDVATEGILGAEAALAVEEPFAVREAVGEAKSQA